MASTFTAQRCEDCSGSLEFDKVRKIWFCPYCGKEYERDLHVDKVQIDGVAGINDVVRATLSDITKYDFSSAQKNLSECEKVNPNHVGTIISNICFYLFSASVASTKDDMQKYLAKTTYYSKLLNEEYPNADQDEVKIYDYCNNPDIYAILYIAYNSIGNHERETLIYNYVQIDPIVEPRINRSLLTLSIKKNKLDDVDKIVDKISFIDKRFTLNEILKKYPDGKRKKEIITNLFNANAFTDKDEKLIESYVKTTSDHSDTKFLVFACAANHKIPINITQLLTDSLMQCTNPDEAKEIFNSLSTIRLSRDDVQIVLDYCLSKNCPNDEVAIAGLHYLKESDALYQIDKDDIIPFIQNKTYPVDELVSIIDVMFSEFKIQTKDRDDITSFVLLQYKDTMDNRKKIIDVILKYVTSITVKTIEDYVLKVKDDGENKPLVIEQIFKTGTNVNYLNSLLSKYLVASVDTEEIKLNIVLLLLKHNLTCQPKDFTSFLLSFKNKIPSKLLEQFKSYNVSPDSNTLIMYFNRGIANVDNEFVDYLLRFKMYSNARCIENYILYTKDYASRKVSIFTSLIKNCLDNDFKSDLSGSYLGNSLKGNLAQIYLLCSNDDAGTKKTIITELLNMMKLSNPMMVNGKSIKFKKFITDNKNNISKDIDNLCQEFGVYKLFF